MNEIILEIKKTIAKLMSIQYEHIEEFHHLSDHLGMGWVEKILLMWEFEEKYKINITLRESWRLTTVRESAQLVLAKIDKKS